MDIRDHSVYFGSYNTWDTWHLVPSSRPTPSIPEVRTNFVEVPGMNGSLDLTEALAGTIFYNDRELETDFILVDQSMNWIDVYTDVVDKLHGKRMKIKLVDDPDWYYMGRVTVSEFASNSDYSSISISCTMEPFKYPNVEKSDTMKVYYGDTYSHVYNANYWAIVVGKLIPPNGTFPSGQYNAGDIGPNNGSEFLHYSPAQEKNSHIYSPKFTVLDQNITTQYSDRHPYLQICYVSPVGTTYPYSFHTIPWTGSLTPGYIVRDIWDKERWHFAFNIVVDSTSQIRDFNDTDYVELKIDWNERSL